MEVKPILDYKTTVTTFAGTGLQGYANGDKLVATFNKPKGIKEGADGVIYIADSSNFLIRQISTLGVVSVLAGNRLPNVGVPGAALQVGFNLPTDLVLDAANNVYISDTSNNYIREYMRADATVRIFSGDGGFGSDGTASFGFPEGIVLVDQETAIVLCDTFNNILRRVNIVYEKTKIAGTGAAGSADGPANLATFRAPSGVVVDSRGDMFISDTGNNVIRKLSNGQVTTFAGSGTIGKSDGQGILASFRGLTGIAIDSNDNIYVADTLNHLIRKVTPSGMVSTIAGTGEVGAVDGNGHEASFNGPKALCILKDGGILISDTLNNKIRILYAK